MFKFHLLASCHGRLIYSRHNNSSGTHDRKRNQKGNGFLRGNGSVVERQNQKGSGSDESTRYPRAQTGTKQGDVPSSASEIKKAKELYI